MGSLKPRLFGPWPHTIYHRVMAARYRNLYKEALRDRDPDRAADHIRVVNRHEDRLVDGYNPGHAVVAIACFVFSGAMALTAQSSPRLSVVAAVSVWGIAVAIVFNMRKAWKSGLKKLTELKLPEEEEVIPL